MARACLPAAMVSDNAFSTDQLYFSQMPACNRPPASTQHILGTANRPKISAGDLTAPTTHHEFTPQEGVLRDS